MGAKFWESISKEHGIHPSGLYEGIDPLQLDCITTYYHESHGGRYVPRAILVDLEPGTLERIQMGPLKYLFRSDNYIHGQNGAGNNWAKGFYNEGAEMLDSVLDVVRRETECCDSLQGFQFCHSIGGGTGGGLGALLMFKIREDFPDKMISSFPVFPSSKYKRSAVNLYNAVLSLHYLTEYSDTLFCLDEHSLQAIYDKEFRINQCTASHLNNLAASVMCGVTSSLRFPGHLNSDLRKLAYNLVPFPRLHFLLLSHAPLISPYSTGFTFYSDRELFQQIFSFKNVLADCDPRHGRYLTASAIFRGQVSAKQVEELHLPKKNVEFVKWIPDNLKCTYCSVPLPGFFSRSATLISNHTAIQELFTKLSKQFSALYKRNAYVTWYLGEGMDKMEFTEAESNLHDLIAEYQQYQEEDTEQDTEVSEPLPDQNLNNNQ